MTTGLSTDGFQSFVNILPAPGVPGDFTGANIRANVVAGSGAFVASPGGVAVGTIGWANPDTGVLSQYWQANAFPCFIHRDNQGLITTFLGISTVLVPGNTEITGMDQGDFLGIFAGGSTAGQKVYVNASTGALTSAAAGGSVTATITAGGAAITVSGGVATLTTTDADVTGTIAAGQVVTSSGTGVPVGTYISAANGTGSGTHLWTLANYDGTAIVAVTAGSLTWEMYGATETQFYVARSVQAPVTSTACTIAAPVGAGGASVLTTSGALSAGSIQEGMFVTGTGVAALTQILSQLSGTAGAAGGATYAVTAQPAVTSFTATFAGGLLARISSWTRST